VVNKEKGALAERVATKLVDSLLTEEGIKKCEEFQVN